jgi:tripeptide aminopeptidase
MWRRDCGDGHRGDEDDAGPAAGAECGNLLARIPGRSERSVLLCAHLDTVEQTAPIEPVVVDGGWENANDGILGADNKAAVAVMLELARRARVEGSPGRARAAVHGLGGERAGRRQAVRRRRLRSEFGYVFDHATRSAR